MHLLREEVKERMRAFDTIVDKNRQALAAPKVVEVLGNYATVLTGVNDRLFMPDVRGTEIKLPKSREADNAPALLPLLRDDPQRGLNWTPMMIVPGKVQFDMTIQRIASGNSGMSETQARQSVLGL